MCHHNAYYPLMAEQEITAAKTIAHAITIGDHRRRADLADRGSQQASIHYRTFGQPEFYHLPVPVAGFAGLRTA